MDYTTGRNYYELNSRLNKLNEDYECRNMSSYAREKQKAEIYNGVFWEHMTVGAVSNSLKEGSDGSGGYLVPDTFEKEIIDGIKEVNFFKKTRYDRKNQSKNESAESYKHRLRSMDKR